MGSWNDDDDSVWSDVRRFADRHIRVFTIGLCVLTIPLALFFLLPTILVATATPITTPVRLKATLSLTYLDKQGKVIGRQGPVAGQYVRLTQLPAYLPQAFIAMEDRRFYAHHGVDLLGLSRAAYTDLRARRFVAGGSTISQQTAKNIFLWQGESVSRYIRKIPEAYFTAMIELIWGKKRILEVYLNTIEMGKGIYGIEAAARQYYHKHAKVLTQSEAANIIACLPNPKVYTIKPQSRFVAWKSQWILRQMRNIEDDPGVQALTR